MRIPSRLVLTPILAGALVAGCADDSDPGGQQPTSSPTSRGVTASEAMGDLITVSNMAVGGTTARANLTSADIADLVADFEGNLDASGCVSGALISADRVQLSFDGCALDGEIIDGDVELSLIAKASGVVIAFDGNLEIDGCGFDGAWSLAVTASSIDFDADVQLTHGSEVVGHAVASASYSWASNVLCPTIDLSVELTSGDDRVSVDIDGADACFGLCSSGASVTIDANGVVVSGSPSDAAIVIGDGDDLLSIGCGTGGVIIGGDGGGDGG
ncbi:MAG: hypothetical protein KJO07_18430, partial [Deltaproteobacteria bacterium]|nr:hypothetical protein [Deltaproteobacteria bacterium]